LRKELENEYNIRIQSHIERENQMTRRMADRERELNQSQYDYRQMMQREIDELRNALIKSSTEPNVHVIVSFGREALGQTGIGHFSPIAAVHPEKDLALVLDVARFKYPPYWVKIDELHAAMKGIDPETGKPRGFSLIKLKRTD
jgi:glutathione gamma-glutamylcysteinyltransferase